MTQAPPVGEAPAADATPPARAHRASGLLHIDALDGARGIAVLLVVGYHFVVPGLSGGFLGVDLFFVLSGFLITTLLMSEHQGSGRIDLVAFWLRRARRLLPALFLLLAVVVMVTALQGDALEKTAARGDLLASIAYVTNWHFIAQGTSYFTESAGASPLRHLWSLAIEEQFYVLWPLVVTALFAVMIRRVAGGRALVTALWVAATLGSAALVIVLYEPADPARAYFGTDARAHELLIGAGLACLMARLPRAERAPSGDPSATTRVERLQVLAGYLGLIGVAALVLTLTDRGQGYYYGGSLLFSVAAAALIAGAIGPRSAMTTALSWRPLVWVGSVSYGLYLWHWPMVIWLSAEGTELTKGQLLLVRGVATIGATIASFYLVERPIRRGTIRSIPLRPIIAFPGALVVALVLVAGTLVATRGRASTAELDAFDSHDYSIAASEVVGASAPRIAIVGDSVARSLWSGVRAEANRRGWSAYRAAFSSCEIGDLFNVDLQGRPFDTSKNCQRLVPQRQAELVARHDPSVVLWYSGRDRNRVIVDGRELSAGSRAWRRQKFADWDRTLARLTRGGAHVVLLLPVPLAGTRAECERAMLRPVTCSRAGNVSDNGIRLTYLEWTRRHRRRLEVFDTATVACPGGMPCPAVLEGVQLRFDSVHYTNAGAALVAPKLFDRTTSSRRLSR